MAKATNGRFAKVIFFISDFQPTDADMEAAGEIGPGVVFRNGMYVPENPSPGSIEVCDFVAGENIPKPYADRFPRWDGSDEGEAAPAKLFDHDKAGNNGLEVAVILPGTVPTSETGSPVDPATNVSLDADGNPLVRAQTASDEGRDLVEPANAAPAIVGNSTEPAMTGRADATAHERTGPDGANAANAAAAGASPAPTTPATPAATPTPAAKPDTAPAKAAANPKVTAKPAVAPAKPVTSWKPNG